MGANEVQALNWKGQLQCWLSKICQQAKSPPLILVLKKPRSLTANQWNMWSHLRKKDRCTRNFQHCCRYCQRAYELEHTETAEKESSFGCCKQCPEWSKGIFHYVYGTQLIHRWFDLSTPSISRSELPRTGIWMCNSNHMSHRTKKVVACPEANNSMKNYLSQTIFNCPCTHKHVLQHFSPIGLFFTMVGLTECFFEYFE